MVTGISDRLFPLSKAMFVVVAFLAGAYGMAVETAEAQISTDRAPKLATAVCIARFTPNEPGRCYRPEPVIYSEVNYIDPVGNGCLEGLCTNDVGGAINATNPINGAFNSPGTFWTQSQNAYLHKVRVIVFGKDKIINPTHVFNSWDDFAPFDWRVELWEGFDEYAASPDDAPVKTLANLEPVNPNVDTAVGNSSQGYPTFEAVFDVSDYNFFLEEGKDYVLVVRSTGDTILHGWVLRSGSEIGAPADVAASDLIPAGFVHEPPHNWPINRIGTEIKVRLP